MIRKLFVQEEMRSERYANYARFFFSFLYFTVGFGIKEQIPDSSFTFLIAGATVNLLFSFVVYFITKKNVHYEWLKYLSTALDVIVLSLFIYSIGTYRSFKTEAFLLYFVWVGLATIRFSPKLTLITGTSSVLSFLLITLLALNDQTIALGTITEAFTTEKISLANIAMKLIFLSMFVGIAVYISNIYHTLVSKAIDKVLIEKQNIALSKTLHTLEQTQEELHSTNRELRYISETDSLSQLYNRRKIEELLNTISERAKFHGEGFSLILLDIDFFKKINDELGHPMGDKVIVQIANNLKKNVRDVDAVGRWGGEEFLILCPNLDTKSAVGLAERLRTKIQFDFGELKRTVTCSLGVTQWLKGDSAAEIVKRVDQALYRSKHHGRNCVTSI